MYLKSHTGPLIRCIQYYFVRHKKLSDSILIMIVLQDDLSLLNFTVHNWTKTFFVEHLNSFQLSKNFIKFMILYVLKF